MNTNEAVQILGNFNDAVNTLKSNALAYDNLIISFRKKEEECKDLKKGNEFLKKENRDLKRHLDAFFRNATYDICPDCDGAGTIQYENEYGWETEPCKLCQETGIIDKKVLEEMEANKPKPVTQLDEEDLNNSDEWPF